MGSLIVEYGFLDNVNDSNVKNDNKELTGYEYYTVKKSDILFMGNK